MTESSSVAFKRGPSPENTYDVFGVDVSFLVETQDAGGSFSILEYVSKPGHEPPPHWHQFEDEVVYLLEGELEVYCNEQVLEVHAGECLFLPKGKPHGWFIRSPQLRALIVMQPAGAEQAFKLLGKPKIGSSHPESGGTYTSVSRGSDNPLKQSVDFGIHIMTREEIAAAMPRYPLPVMS